jgi:hypothetical protein
MDERTSSFVLFVVVFGSLLLLLRVQQLRDQWLHNFDDGDYYYYYAEDDAKKVKPTSTIALPIMYLLPKQQL